MKKFLFFLTFAALLTFSASARSGDIAGTYYSTDIRTYLNGEEISAINVGGETLISAEDMAYYGFSVDWDAAARTLSVRDTQRPPSRGVPPAVVRGDLPSGTPIGPYYETDIVTYLDGTPFTAYNVGGRTYLHAEQMATLGYVVVWDAEARTLSVTTAKRAGYVYYIPLTDGAVQQAEATGSFSVAYEPGRLSTSGDATYFFSTLSCNGKVYWLSVSFYQNLGLPWANALIRKMEAFTAVAYGEPLHTDEDCNAAIAGHFSVRINGIPAGHITVVQSGGNGHTDFYFTLDGIPLYTEQEIHSVEFTLDPDEQAEVRVTEIAPALPSASEAVLARFGKNENEYAETFYTFADYSVVAFYESPQFGVQINHLYLVRHSDLAISEDLLTAVRAVPGFDLDLLSPFDFRSAEDGRFTFSVVTDTLGASFSAKADLSPDVRTVFVTER